MDDDESSALIVFSVFAVVVVFNWFRSVLSVKQFRSVRLIRSAFISIPIFSLIAVAVVLQTEADPQVVRSPGYFLMFLNAGVAWLRASVLVLSILGVDPIRDAIERGNAAAAIVSMSGLIAVTIVYAASNIGTGPTIWTTFGPAAIGLCLLAGSWLAHRIFSPAWEDVAVGRDTVASLRLGGFLIGSAIIVAAPLAGNWISVSAFMQDVLRRAWPVIPMIAFVTVADRSLTPTIERPIGKLKSDGLFFAGLLIAMAILLATGLK